MRTATQTAGGRVAIWQAKAARTWWWGSEPGGLDFCGPFPTLELAIRDAQAVRGPAVAITHHSASVSREAGGEA